MKIWHWHPNISHIFSITKLMIIPPSCCRNMSENSTLQPQPTTGSSVGSTSSESTITMTTIAQQAAEVESASSSNYVGQRGPKRKAPLWNYFDEIKTGNDIFAVCKQTDCSYRNKGENNSTLKNHLVKHPEQYDKYLNQQAEFECRESAKIIQLSQKSNLLLQGSELFANCVALKQCK